MKIKPWFYFFFIKVMKNNPNLAGVIICSISFFLLFTAYQTLQARLSSVFEDLVFLISTN